MVTAATTAAILPSEGVMPPSSRLSHSSSLPAPPATAARAEATLSTQASKSMALGMARQGKIRNKCPQ
jgi:hypothetical protein